MTMLPGFMPLINFPNDLTYLNRFFTSENDSFQQQIIDINKKDIISDIQRLYPVLVMLL